MPPTTLGDDNDDTAFRARKKEVDNKAVADVLVEERRRRHGSIRHHTKMITAYVSEEEEELAKGEQQNPTTNSNLIEDLIGDIRDVVSPMPAAAAPSRPGAFSVGTGTAPAAGQHGTTSTTTTNMAGASTTDNNANLAVANPVANPQDLQRARGVGDSAVEDRSEEQQAKDQEAKGTCAPQNQILWGTRGTILLLAVLVVLVSLLLTEGGGNDKDSAPDSPIIETLPSATAQTAPSESSSPRSREEHVLSLLPGDSVAAIREDPSSPQGQAYDWLIHDATEEEDGGGIMLSNDRILQRFALATLYFATAGDHWLENTNWLRYDVHECNWFQKPDFALSEWGQRMIPMPRYGDEFLEQDPPLAACDQEGLLQNLWLDQNNLVGWLPDQIYLLTNLQTLSLSLLNWGLESGMHADDGIQRLSNLEGLVYLDTRKGELPSELGLLTKLRHLNAYDNGHTGPVPDEIWRQLTSLQTLIFNGNPQLDGTLPTYVSSLSSLKHLSLERSGLTGTIPTEMGTLSHLIWWSARDTMFTGTIPTELGLLDATFFMDLGGCSLQGTIPTELGDMKGMSLFMALEGNELTGAVPTQLGLLTDLAWGLYLNNNGMLTGLIPTELGQLERLHYLKLDNNQLEGNIPSELGLLSSLGLLHLANNTLSGTVPQELSSLEDSLHTLDIRGNSLLSGELPGDLCNVSATCVGFIIGLVGCDSTIEGLSFDCNIDERAVCGCGCSCND